MIPVKSNLGIMFRLLVMAKKTAKSFGLLAILGGRTGARKDFSAFAGA